VVEEEAGVVRPHMLKAWVGAAGEDRDQADV